MRNAHCKTWRMARKLKIMENDSQTVFDLEYASKIQKRGK
jgi:hypothetical protein